jgi:hypothetical protein
VKALRTALASATALLSFALLLPASPAAGAVAGGFTFGAAGDFGATSRTATTLDNMGSQTDFALAIGDLSYSQMEPESDWCDWVKSHVGQTFPFELVSGDQEMDGAPDGDIDKFAACLPDRMGGVTGAYGKQYYFDYPKGPSPLARFIMISPSLELDGSKWSYDNGTARQQWLINAIRSARAGGIPWVIVGNHTPCLSATSKPCAIGNDVNNVFIREGVDLVLQGHSHTYERGKQLALSSSCTKVSHGTYKSACVADSGADNAYDKGKGTIFLIDGVSGKSISTIESGKADASYFAKLMGSNKSPTYGFTKYDVTRTQIRAVFVPSSSGSFRDEFTIGTASPPPPPDGTAPTASLTAPLDGATVVGTVTAQATASDNVGVTKVELAVDGVTVAVDTTVPYALPWNSTTVANGPHTLTARAFDAAGNTGTSPPVTVTVDNPPPDLTNPIVDLTAPLDGATVVGTVTAQATASDNVGVTKVELAVDGAPVAVDTTAPYDLPWNSTTVGNGPHTLIARAYDAAGNVGLSAPPVNVTVNNPQTVFNSAPVADATINKSNPNTRDPSPKTLMVDTSPDVLNALIKLDTSAIPGTYTSVKLTLHCVDDSPQGGVFNRAGSEVWNESTVTWNTAPTLGTPIAGATLGEVQDGSQYQVELKDFVTGPGVWTIRMTTPSSNGADYASINDGTASLRPSLVVTTSG